MPTKPKNQEDLLCDLREKISTHQELYSKDRLRWRERFYEFLCPRQVKRWAEKNLRTKHAWKDLMLCLTLEQANKTKHWGIADFFKESLGVKCTCRNLEKNGGEGIDKKKMRFTCPEVPADEADTVLDGRDPHDVRAFILGSSNYRVMKLSTKLKGYSEPQYNLIYEMGRQFFLLTSSTVPSIGKRQQNVYSIFNFQCIFMDFSIKKRHRANIPVYR